MQNHKPAMQQDQAPAKKAGGFLIGGDLQVTRLGYGAMRVTGDGVWGEPADRAEAVRVLRRAVELGINFIDTADSYGPGAVSYTHLDVYKRQVDSSTRTGLTLKELAQPIACRIAARRPAAASLLNFDCHIRIVRYLG